MASEIRRISGSEFKSWRRCHRQHMLGYSLQITPRERDVGPLEEGSLTHIGIEQLYEGGDLSASLRAIASEAESMVHMYPEEDILRAAHDAQNYARGYVEWLEMTGADQRYELIGVEEELEMPLVTIDETEYVFIGKLDRRVFDKLRKVQRFIDYKTCTSFEDLILDAHRNEQFPGYELLLRHNYPDERINGGIWRMILKQKRARDGDKKYFEDYEREYNDQVLDSVRKRYISLCYDIHRATHERILGEEHNFSHPPHPTYSCKWDCEFVGICDMMDDGSRWEQAADALFVRHDPYERYDILNDKKGNNE